MHFSWSTAIFIVLLRYLRRSVYLLGLRVFPRTNLENCNKLLFTYASLYRHQATLKAAVSLLASDRSLANVLSDFHFLEQRIENFSGTSLCCICS